MTGVELSEEGRRLRALWRECAEKDIDGGINYQKIVRTLFKDLDAAEAVAADLKAQQPFRVAEANRLRAEAAEAERDNALAVAKSMDHFAEVAVRCEAKSNEYAAENARLTAERDEWKAECLRWRDEAEAGSFNALMRRAEAAQAEVKFLQRREAATVEESIQRDRRLNEVRAEVARLTAELAKAEALVEAGLALADEWEKHSNQVSKFIDSEHAEELRAALGGAK